MLESALLGILLLPLGFLAELLQLQGCPSVVLIISFLLKTALPLLFRHIVLPAYFRKQNVLSLQHLQISAYSICIFGISFDYLLPQGRPATRVDAEHIAVCAFFAGWMLDCGYTVTLEDRVEALFVRNELEVRVGAAE